MPSARAVAMLKLRAKNGSAAAADELQRLGLAIEQVKLDGGNGNAANVANKPTPAELAEIARHEARLRASNVMRSAAYQGREKQAAALLLASCDHGSRFTSSTAIVAELKTRPSDAELAAQQARATQADIEAAWSNAAKRVGMCMFGGLSR